MGLLDRFIQNKNGGSVITMPSTAQTETPEFDSSNAMASLKALVGPSPAEREAQLRKAQEGKAQMAAWTGLFDGLRHMGNLYYATKGAPSQKFTDNPYQQIDQNYLANLKRADDIANYNRQYAQVLYNLQRQAKADERQDKFYAARSRYYDSLAGAKDDAAEATRARTEQTRARTAQINERTEQLKKMFPLQEKKLRAIIDKYRHDANKPYSTRSSSNSASAYEELATHLQDDPDVIGPILQQEGVGIYDPETKQFTFTKNPTAGLVHTANSRARQQGGKSNKDYSQYKKTPAATSTTNNKYDKYKKNK